LDRYDHATPPSATAKPANIEGAPEELLTTLFGAEGGERPDAAESVLDE
jgi:hypothetical protein